MIGLGPRGPELFKFVPKWPDTSLSSLEWEVSAIEACSPR